MTVTATIEWDAPPRKYLKWPPTVEALRGRPGVWAKVTTRQTSASARTFASNVRRGYGAFAPRGSFEAVSADCRVWARYVGQS